MDKKLEYFKVALEVEGAIEGRWVSDDEIDVINAAWVLTYGKRLYQAVRENNMVVVHKVA